jgi:hypothetical protein
MISDLEPFPAHALAPLQRSMGEAVASVLTIGPEIPYCCTLSATSAACGRSLMVSSGPNRKIGANTYFLIGGVSGLGKSSLFRPCFEPLHSFQTTRFNQFIKIDQPRLRLEKLKLKKELEIYKKSVGKKNNVTGQDNKMMAILARLDELEIELRPPQVVCEDTTTEALALVLKANREQVFSLSPDADKVFRNIEGRYVSGKTLDESLYVKAFSRDPHCVNRISRESIYLESPCMSICWMTQPDRLNRLFANSEFRDGGLLPRFLVVNRSSNIAEIPKVIPRIDSKLQYAYHDMIMGLLVNFWDSQCECLIPESAETYEAMRQYHNSLVPQMNGVDADIASFLKRLAEQAWRIAVCIHAALFRADCVNRPISLKTAQGAIEIARWHAQEQLRVLEPVRELTVYESFQKLIQFLQIQPQWEAATREVQRRFHWSREQLDKVVGAFSRCFSIDNRPPPRRGGHPVQIDPASENAMKKPSVTRVSHLGLPRENSRVSQVSPRVTSPKKPAWILYQSRFADRVSQKKGGLYIYKLKNGAIMTPSVTT